MKHLVLVGVLLLVSAKVISGSMTFQDAKTKSDQIEESLSQGELGKLVEAQGQLASLAFPYCLNQTNQPPTNFTVVVQVGENGQVSASWLNAESAFGACFQQQMEAQFFFIPPLQPFFTSFEYKNAP